MCVTCVKTPRRFFSNHTRRTKRPKKKCLGCSNGRVWVKTITFLSVHARLKRRRGERKNTHRSETPAFERRRSSANDDDDNNNSDRTNRESLVLRSSFVLRKNREELWVVCCGSKKSDFVSDPQQHHPL